MNEEQARNSWCPMTEKRVAPTLIKDFFNHTCMTSKCMAWRWTVHPDWASANGLAEDGFCGLAGRECE
jgi:hypothetical protein